MITLGASTACLYPMETERALEQMGKLGIKTVEIFYNSPSEYETNFIIKLKSILDYYGMTAISMHPYDSVTEPYMFFTDYRRRFVDGLECYRRYFEQMNRLGSEIFVFHGDRYDSCFAQQSYFERYAALYQLGRSFGITVAQENVQRCKSREPRFIREMTQQLGDQVRFVLDIKQAVRGGESPFEMLDVMAPKLVHIHLNDHDGAQDCLLPGQGKFNFSSFFQKLDTLHYHGTALIEVYRRNFHTEEEILDSLKFLREV